MENRPLWWLFSMKVGARPVSAAKRLLPAALAVALACLAALPGTQVALAVGRAQTRAAHNESAPGRASNQSVRAVHAAPLAPGTRRNPAELPTGVPYGMTARGRAAAERVRSGHMLPTGAPILKRNLSQPALQARRATGVASTAAVETVQAADPLDD